LRIASNRSARPHAVPAAFGLERPAEIEVESTIAVRCAPVAQVDRSERAVRTDENARGFATIDFEAKQLRLIVGGSKGKGVLHFQGKDYPFTAKGASVGGAGYTDVEGTGTVHFLTKVQDFAGTYTGLGIGAALVKGKGASTFQNSKGVVISTKGKADGVALNLGAGAIKITLSK
jgi:hypothetical protein